MTWCERMSKYLLKVAPSRSDGGVWLMRGHRKKLVVLFLRAQTKNVAVTPPEAFFGPIMTNFFVCAPHERTELRRRARKNTEEEDSGNSLHFSSGGGAVWTAGPRCWFRSQDLFEQHAAAVWCWGTKHDERMVGKFEVCYKAEKMSHFESTNGFLKNPFVMSQKALILLQGQQRDPLAGAGSALSFLSPFKRVKVQGMYQF